MRITPIERRYVARVDFHGGWVISNGGKSPVVWPFRIYHVQFSEKYRGQAKEKTYREAMRRVTEAMGEVENSHGFATEYVIWFESLEEVEEVQTMCAKCWHISVSHSQGNSLCLN